MYSLRFVMLGAVVLAALPAYAQAPAPCADDRVSKRCTSSVVPVVNDTGAARTPRREALQQMTAVRIRRTLDSAR